MSLSTEVTIFLTGCNLSLTVVGYHRSLKRESDTRSELGKVLDIETRRKKQQALIGRMLERKVRSRAQQIYESRGQAEGQDLQDWFQAETEVIGNSVAAPLYRRLHGGQEAEDRQEEESAEQPCETGT